MNAITRILMNAVRAYNAERLGKVTKIAEVGNEDRGAGIYADKENSQFLVFFVIKGEHQWECNYEVPTKVEASNIAQAFADGDIKIGSELTDVQAQGLAEQFGYPTPIKASDAQTETLDTESDVEHDVDDNLESGEVEAGQLQGIDRHDDPFYDTPAVDDSRLVVVDRLAVDGDADDFPLEGKKINPSPFKLHPHQQKVVDYINEQALEVMTLGDVSAPLVQVDAEKKPKIKKGRQAQRRAAKRKGNQKPRGYNAQPSNLLDKMFCRNPITVAE